MLSKEVGTPPLGPSAQGMAAEAGRLSGHVFTWEETAHFHGEQIALSVLHAYLPTFLLPCDSALAMVGLRSQFIISADRLRKQLDRQV